MTSFSLTDMFRSLPQQQESNLATDSLMTTLDSNSNSFPVALDVLETADNFLILYDMPGFDKSQVSITLAGQVLTVSGERSDRDRCYIEEADITNRIAIERGYGTFMRTVTLPSLVDSCEVCAFLAEGVLQVHVGKVTPESLKGKSIKIN
ncbi:HSP20-like chaperone [Obelidium mucronatum]|nr:HSP20-like chaperone [Obelidium mucronatum]